MSQYKRILLPIFFALLSIIIWQYLTVVFKIPNYLLPQPTDIGHALMHNSSDFLRASLLTFSVTLIALFLSALTGSLISILLFFNKFVDNMISPFLIILQIIPMVSIIPLLIIWFKSNTIATLIICAWVSSIFPIISSMTAGLKNTDKSLIMIFDIYNSSFLQKLFKLYLPSSLPYFLNGLQISSALALIGGVSGEFIAGSGGRNSGVAYLLLMAGYNLQTDKLFAALFIITLLGIIIHFLFKFLSYNLLKNYN